MSVYKGDVEATDGSTAIPAHVDLYSRTYEHDAISEWGGKLYPKDGNITQVFHADRLTLRFPEGWEAMVIPVEFSEGADYVEVRGSHKAPWDGETS